jgi:hypothetical protein
VNLLERIKAAHAEGPERYQVKFWCKPDLYRRFTETCDRLGFKYAPTFGEFMAWFIEQNVSEPAVNPLIKCIDEALRGKS